MADSTGLGWIRARAWLANPRHIFAFCTGRFTIIAHPTIHITCFVTIWQRLFFALFMYVFKNMYAKIPLHAFFPLICIS